MAARVLPNLEGKEIPFIGTFHSLGARILRKEAKRVGRDFNFVIFDESDSFSLLKKVVKEFRMGQKLGPAFFRNAISEAKDSGKVPEKDSLEGEIVFQVLEKYEHALKENNAFDFDDLISKPRYIFEHMPEAFEKYKKQFTHLLIDEYQDVSGGQYAFVKLLAKNSESITFVGDSDQTIYSWRGSDINIFLGFEKEWPESIVVFLEENYRSTQTIIEAASALIHHNSERPSISKEKELRTENPRGNPILMFEAANSESEADWIASKIENSGPQGTAILYRTNAQSRALEQALLAREIPYIIFGGLKFYERREIKDILAGMRFISNPKDSVSEERLQKTFKKRAFSGIREHLLSSGFCRP
jgi:DNA helicase-2/ATP-dependent DNA helicase PcrA